jgi:hypothetical protein
VRRRDFELWIHRDGNAAALVAIEVELPPIAVVPMPAL